jgi:catechol 2,3-dioxygenase-like lactoylglutathione lyase family enzyme
MSTTDDSTADAGVGQVDMRLEVVVVPVADVDRAKGFYSALGWRLDADRAHGEHEKRIGHADPNWPDWYAAYMVAEQSGAQLPT